MRCAHDGRLQSAPTFGGVVIKAELHFVVFGEWWTVNGEWWLGLGFLLFMLVYGCAYECCDYA